jgi:hypothetical protein
VRRLERIVRRARIALDRRRNKEPALDHVGGEASFERDGEDASVSSAGEREVDDGVVTGNPREGGVRESFERRSIRSFDDRRND